MVVNMGGQDTVSSQKCLTTNCVFYGQFMNTGVMLLLVNANLQEHDPQVITSYFHGPFYDYMPQWYAEVGQKIL